MREYPLVLEAQPYPERYPRDYGFSCIQPSCAIILTPCMKIRLNMVIIYPAATVLGIASSRASALGSSAKPISIIPAHTPTRRAAFPVRETLPMLDG